MTVSISGWFHSEGQDVLDKAERLLADVKTKLLELIPDASLSASGFKPDGTSVDIDNPTVPPEPILPTGAAPVEIAAPEVITNPNADMEAPASPVVEVSGNTPAETAPLTISEIPLTSGDVHDFIAEAKEELSKLEPETRAAVGKFLKDLIEGVV